MPDKSALYDRLGAKALTAPAKPGQPAGAEMRPPMPPKAFDINLYFKAVGMAFDDFFNKKLPYFFKNLGPVFKKFPDWFTKLPNDEKISYGVYVLGNILVIVGIVLFFVL
ncbi:hypothetical protein HZB03_02960 [Candidatus Woesearchaeota archaeon]|nr:hypothetical protein [Candidatus Woesearchaeota archaeon]